MKNKQRKICVYSKKLNKYIWIDLDPELTKEELLNMSMGYSNSAGGSG